MLCLVGGARRVVRRYARTGYFGHLFTPIGRPGAANIDTWSIPGLPWACDNGAFGVFDEPGFVKMLVAFSGRPGCLWVAAPDVVGDAERTLTLFDNWDWFIRDAGYPVALVGQDGLTVDATPWDRMDALFIGGTTEWKLGEQAAELCAEAKARGLHVHVGRVNSPTRLRHLLRLGTVDSFDGSGLSRFAGRDIPPIYRALCAHNTKEVVA